MKVQYVALILLMAAGCSPLPANSPDPAATQPALTAPEASTNSQANLTAGKKLHYRFNIVGDPTLKDVFLEIVSLSAGKVELKMGYTEDLSKALAHKVDFGSDTFLTDAGANGSFKALPAEFSEGSIAIPAGTFKVRQFILVGGNVTTTMWISGSVLVKSITVNPEGAVSSAELVSIK